MRVESQLSLGESPPAGDNLSNKHEAEALSEVATFTPRDLWSSAASLTWHTLQKTIEKKPLFVATRILVHHIRSQISPTSKYKFILCFMNLYEENITFLKKTGISRYSRKTVLEYNTSIKTKNYISSHSITDEICIKY